jgi:hypothetical protein
MSSEICKYTHFFTFNLAVTKKTVGDGEKLLTYLNPALKVLSGLDIFPRGTKKKLNFVEKCHGWELFRHRTGWFTGKTFFLFLLVSIAGKCHIQS